MANMSYANNLYKVMETKSVKEPELEGFTLLPISRTDGKKGKSGICIQVPTVSEAVLNLVFSHPDGKTFFCGCIDKVRSGIASGLHKQGNAITSDRIGLDGILAALRVQNEQSVRFSKEGISTWFNTDLAPVLNDAIQKKLPGISIDKLNRTVSGYLEDFKLLAAREVFISPEIKTKLEKAMMLLPDDYEHIISERISERLSNSMQYVRNVEDVL
jgi:hypothetical protein